jgi:nucleotide-binding universal stress UspA family protein
LNSKILAPVDGSENSMGSLDHAIILSSKLNTTLVILIVLEVPPFVYVQSQKLVNSIMMDLEKEANDILEICTGRAKNYGITVETMFLEGQNAGSIIIDYIEKNNLTILLWEAEDEENLNMLYWEVSLIEYYIIVKYRF